MMTELRESSFVGPFAKTIGRRDIANWSECLEQASSTAQERSRS